MPKENGTSQTSHKPDDLTALEERVKTAQVKRGKYQPKNEEDGSLLGMAWRLSTELVVAVLVGSALGYGLDRLFGTAPWIMVVGIGFGFATGIRNTFRTAGKMDAIQKDVPIGEDLDTEDED